MNSDRRGKSTGWQIDCGVCCYARTTRDERCIFDLNDRMEFVGVGVTRCVRGNEEKGVIAGLVC